METMIPMMKIMEMRMTWDIKQFMMRWLMAHNYGEYDDGGDESGDANPN